MPEPRVLRGSNEVTTKPEATVIATAGSNHGAKRLLVAGTYGKGRAVAGRSDSGPHWLPAAVVARDGYGRLWRQTRLSRAAAEAAR